MWVLLTVVQDHHYPVTVEFLEVPLEKDMFPDIRRAVLRIGIQIDLITPSEIGKEVLAQFIRMDRQRYRIIAILNRRTLSFDDL